MRRCLGHTTVRESDFRHHHRTRVLTLCDKDALSTCFRDFETLKESISNITNINGVADPVAGGVARRECAQQNGRRASQSLLCLCREEENTTERTNYVSHPINIILPTKSKGMHLVDVRAEVVHGEDGRYVERGVVRFHPCPRFPL